MTLSYARENETKLRIARLLDWLVMDYITLRTTFPTPTSDQIRTSPKGSREYGHPAQWASDTARSIADCLDAADEALRDHLGHTPPPPRTRAENRVVAFAYTSLKARLESLANYPGTDAFHDEAQQIHGAIRRALGQTKQRKPLDLPCPRCSFLPVFRTVHDDRRDIIECDHCSYQIKEQEYGLYVRIVIDELIQQADNSNHLTETS